MKKLLPISLLLIFACVVMISCGGGSSSTPTPTPATPTSSMFITAEDTPLASVLAFNITLNSITLQGQNGSPQALQQPQTVDFARLLGLRTLVGFATVPPDTYKSATLTLASPVISYLNLSTNPPAVGTINGTLTTTSVTVNFDQPLVVGTNGMAGLHMDFNLRQSVELDASGNVTGVVDPHIALTPILSGDDNDDVTDLRGGLVSVSIASNSFVLQRVNGQNITVDVNNQTNFNTGSLSTMTPPMVVEVEGVVQGDGSILASAVEIVATTKAFVSGVIVAVNPASGPAQQVTLLVSEELPFMSGITVDMPATIDVSKVTNYSVSFFDKFGDNFESDMGVKGRFDSSSLVAGQRILIGGSVDSTGSTLVAAGVSLRRQGIVGMVDGSTVNVEDGNKGTFQLMNNSLIGYILGGPLTVETGPQTQFNGLGELKNLASDGGMVLEVRGVMLKNPSTGKAELFALKIRELKDM